MWGQNPTYKITISYFMSSYRILNHGSVVLTFEGSFRHKCPSEMTQKNQNQIQHAWFMSGGIGLLGKGDRYTNLTLTCRVSYLLGKVVYLRVDRSGPCKPASQPASRQHGVRSVMHLPTNRLRGRFGRCQICRRGDRPPEFPPFSIHLAHGWCGKAHTQYDPK